MKKLILPIFLIAFKATGLFSQTTLFDNSRVSSVYIEIHPDSLAYIMTHVLSDHYFKARFVYDHGTGRDTLPDVGFRLRGNTSRYAQKKSFKISFNEYVSGRKYQGVKKINLNGQHNDPTLIREKLFYDTWNKAGMAERRTSFVRLFINQSYYGLYTNLEEFDKEWLDRVYNEKSGNLYKCTYPADLVYFGNDQLSYKNIMSGSATGGRAYDLQTNEDQDNYSDLVGLITLLDGPADTVFAVQIGQQINVDGFLKAFALDVATGNWDDYMYNKNNYFLYYRTDTQKFEFISYDTDNTFGVDWIGVDWATRDCLDWYNHGEQRPLARKLLSLPVFYERYRRFLDTITREVTLPDSIFPHIDGLKNLIVQAVQEDNFRKLDYGYTINDFFNGFSQTVDGHTPYGIKPFLEKRREMTMDQISTSTISENAEKENCLELFPNPATNEIRMKLKTSDHTRTCLIADIQGRVCRKFVLEKNQQSRLLDISGLKEGLYFLTVADNDHIMSKLFIKQ